MHVKECKVEYNHVSQGMSEREMVQARHSTICCTGSHDTKLTNSRGQVQTGQDDERLEI